MKEYMESELSDIFLVKLVTKTLVRGSAGTQFMHMRVKVKKKKNATPFGLKCSNLNLI